LGFGLRLGYLATSGANLTSNSCSPTPISQFLIEVMKFGAYLA